MTDATASVEITEPAAPKRRVKGLIFGLLGGLALGGAGFAGVYSGLLDLGGLAGGAAHDADASAEEVDFIAMEPIIVSLPPGASARHLRFLGQLEVLPAQSAEVAQLMPRITDVLNTYLRAVDVKDIEDPASIQRLRAQMLRRIQVVVGEGRVADLLITEFILN